MGDRIIRVRRQETRKVYIHNDLESAAYYFQERIKAKLEDDDRDGIAFECMACATMLAFTWEAYLNFFGHKLVSAYWKERQAINKKVDQVFQRLRITPKWAINPYKSVVRLKEVRNILAHGKPVEETIDEIEEGPQSKMQRRRIELSGKWEQFCTTDVVLQACDDLQTIWDEMFKASGLGAFDTMTHGEGGVTYIEDVVETKIINKQRNKNP
jgi:hypothetical protein